MGNDCTTIGSTVINSDLGREVEFILGRLSVYHRANTEMDNLKSVTSILGYKIQSCIT